MLEIVFQIFLIIVSLTFSFFVSLVIFLLIIKRKEKTTPYKKPQTELEEIFGYAGN